MILASSQSHKYLTLAKKMLFFPPTQNTRNQKKKEKPEKKIPRKKVSHRVLKCKAHNALSDGEGRPSLDPAYEGPSSCRTPESVDSIVPLPGINSGVTWAMLLGPVQQAVRTRTVHDSLALSKRMRTRHGRLFRFGRHCTSLGARCTCVLLLLPLSSVQVGTALPRASRSYVQPERSSAVVPMLGLKRPSH